MNDWLKTLSKNTLAFLAIAGGMILIILLQPPHSICDSQIELIKSNEMQFLEKKPKKKEVEYTRTMYQELMERCKATNDPGGCYELFQHMKALLDDLGTLPDECVVEGGAIGEVRTALWETLELMVRLAWREKPPAAYNAKFGWLDTADVSLFCKLKSRMTQMYGETSLNSFREKMMLELPGAKEITRNQVWEMSLFSENCSRYP